MFNGNETLGLSRYIAALSATVDYFKAIE